MIGTQFGYYLRILFFSLLLINSGAGSSTILQIDSFAQAAEVLQNADENWLILFDCDYTLFVPENNLCWYKTKDWHRNKHRYEPWVQDLLDAIFTKMKKDELHYKSIWHAKETPLLTEPAIIQLIHSLQNRNVKVLALTAIRTGHYSTIASLPEWRFNKLQELSIDFRKAQFEDMIFDHLEHDWDGFYPVLYKGILCTGTESKGKVLVAFLDQISWKPSHIVFFDDTISHVQDVGIEMDNRAITCTGFEYLGAYTMPCTLNKDIITLQLHHLIDHEDWLSQDQARELLAKCSESN